MIAGAGSGKTRALTHRFAYLVTALGVSTSRIWCVTFTNKAAGEMKKRIRKMIGDRDLALIGTFHGFCVRLLREESHFVQYPKEFTVLDEEDANQIVRICFARLGLTSKDITVDEARAAIHRFKRGYVLTGYIPLLSDATLSALTEARKNAPDMTLKAVYEYLYEQRKCYGLDFQDLIKFTLHILTYHTEARVRWQKRLEYIMVDEFQDVSADEYNLTRILSCYHHNLFIVGDPDQTIYEWRKAKIGYILDFDKDYPSSTTFIMNKNYRSLPEIIRASNTLISKNALRIEKDLIPMRSEKGHAVYFHAKTQQLEVQFVVQQIQSLIAQGIKRSDIAILYRAHKVSRPFEEKLLSGKIDYTLYNGIPFYSRKEIKDILSYLRLLIYPDDLSFERIVNEPARGIGKSRMAFLRDYAAANRCTLYDALAGSAEEPRFASTKAAEFIGMIEKYKVLAPNIPLTDLMSALLDESGYEEFLRVSGDTDRLDNLAELKQSIYDYENAAGEETNLGTYLQQISLYTNTDRDPNLDVVKMMTVHAAKGLEFPVVFLCGMNEGMFTSSRTQTQPQLEEERRLAYVAFTRAMDKLYITESEGLNFDSSFRYPSRFIFNAGKENLRYIVALESAFESTARGYINALEQLLGTSAKFKEGDAVLHDHFGKGVITQIDDVNSCCQVLFYQLKTPRSIDFSVNMTLCASTALV